MDHDELAQRITLIEESAPRLRAAGVTSIRVAGDAVTVTYAPPYGPDDPPPAAGVSKPSGETAPDLESDPLDDPDTYGGEVPGFDLEEPA
jgi:hypothetical protein